MGRDWDEFFSPNHFYIELIIIVSINNIKKATTGYRCFFNIIFFRYKNFNGYKTYYLLPIAGGIYSALLVNAKGWVISSCATFSV